jgi:glutaminase
MASLKRRYISTGHSPASGMVQSLVQDTHRRSKSNSDSKNSQAYPALARVLSELFGVCVVGTSGRIYGAGDVDHEFSVMSVSNPFLFALICEATTRDRPDLVCETRPSDGVFLRRAA